MILFIAESASSVANFFLISSFIFFTQNKNVPQCDGFIARVPQTIMRIYLRENTCKCLPYCYINFLSSARIYLIVFCPMR